MRDLSNAIGSPVSVHPRSPDGYAEALRRFYELEQTAHRPFYRRSGVGWMLLNVPIGFVWSLGLLVLESGGAILVHAGAILVHGGVLERTTEPSNFAITWSTAISIPAGIIGWLLFCHLPTPLSRGLGLAIPYVGAFVVGGALLASSMGPVEG